MGNIADYEPFWNGWRISGPPLGQGSYGTVYRIEKEEFGQVYYAAMKHIAIPSEREDPGTYDDLTGDVWALEEHYCELLDDLISEITINNRLKGHTNIVSYEDHDVIPNGQGYDVIIKMELLTSLPDYIRNHDMKVRDIVRLGIEICTALTVLQREKIIHRDIKPANIFINSGGDYKLGDFGVAKVMEQASEGMSMRGTLTYMAPEVARGEEGDYRLDLYSLGLVLYRLLNQNRTPLSPLPPQKPKQVQISEANRRRIRGEAFPAPSMADEVLGQIVLKTCAFHPNERWEDAGELKKQLLRYQDEAPPETLDTVVLNRQADSPAYTGAMTGAGTAAAAEEGMTELVRDDATELVQNPDATVLLSQEDAEGTFDPDDEPTDPDHSPDSAPASNAVPAQAPGKKKPPIAVICAVGAVAVIGGALLLLKPGAKPAPAATATPTPSPSHMVSVSPSPSPAAETGIVWQDPIIEAGVRKAIGKLEGQIALSDVASLTELHIRSQEAGTAVATLADLGSLPELRILDLSGTAVSDTAGLEQAVKLEELDLTGCGCQDGAIPDTLTQLRDLAVGNNQLTDLSFVQSMPNLSHLDIHGNPVTDLSPLSGVSASATLIADGIQAEDWTSVAHIVSVLGKPVPVETTAPMPTPKPKATPKPKPKATPVPDTPAPVVSLTPTPAPTPSPAPDQIAVTGVSLSQNGLILEVGGMAKLSATVSPWNATDQSVSWSSSNSGVVRVSGGTVTAIASGTATITASCGGHSASCTVTVN